MKRFIQFVSEEVDLRGNKGIPNDFMRNADEEARRSLRIRPDDERQMAMMLPEFQRNMMESSQLLLTGPDGRRLTQQQMQERVRRLEELAKKVVMDQFGELLETSIKPID